MKATLASESSTPAAAGGPKKNGKPTSKISSPPTPEKEIR
jgi:hypothetical protein